LSAANERPLVAYFVEKLDAQRFWVNGSQMGPRRMAAIERHEPE